MVNWPAVNPATVNSTPASLERSASTPMPKSAIFGRGEPSSAVSISTFGFQILVQHAHAVRRVPPRPPPQQVGRVSGVSAPDRPAADHS